MRSTLLLPIILAVGCGDNSLRPPVDASRPPPTDAAPVDSPACPVPIDSSPCLPPPVADSCDLVVVDRSDRAVRVAVIGHCSLDQAVDGLVLVGTADGTSSTVAPIQALKCPGGQQQIVVSDSRILAAPTGFIRTTQGHVNCTVILPE